MEHSLMDYFFLFTLFFLNLLLLPFEDDSTYSELCLTFGICWFYNLFNNILIIIVKLDDGMCNALLFTLIKSLKML